MKDFELSKLTRDMNTDEKEIFLDIYNRLDAEAIETALQQTAVKLAETRRERAEAARLKIIEVNAELERLGKEYSEWRASQEAGALLPEAIGKKRSRMETLIQEREKLAAIIKGDK